MANPHRAESTSKVTGACGAQHTRLLLVPMLRMVLCRTVKYTAVVRRMRTTRQKAGGYK